MSSGDLAARRRARALPGGARDRRVALLKVALPIAAGLLLLTFLLLPLTARQEFSFLLSKDDVTAARERLRVERASYRGSDEQGRPFAVTARQAIQRTSAVPVVEISGIAAELQAPDGPSRVTADKGRYDIGKRTLSIDGPVDFSGGDGMRLATRDVRVDLGARQVESGGPADGRVRLGSFRSGRLRADVTGRVVTLDRGVSLHIDRQGGRGR